MTAPVITISIGRNVGATPMTRAAWDNFHADILATITTPGADVYVPGAHSVGEWEGVSEESRTYVASVPEDYVPAIRTRLAHLAHAYRQDAIALTVGVGSLVDARKAVAA
jgi:hypothetical protein